MVSLNSDRNKLWGIGLAILLPLAVIGLAFAAFISFKVYRMFNPYLDREIGGAVTLTSEWLEITPQEPLRPERQVQYLYVDTPEPFDPDYQSWGIRFPDGSVIVPEVQLIDQQGNVYNLKASSFSLADSTRTDIVSGIGFRARGVPQDRVYPKVRIRSDKPIRASRIIWRSYDPRDRK
jgi:hypothetical protein